MEDFDSGAPQVAQELEVNGELLADLNNMLRVIIEKRTRALGAIERRGTGCQHYGYFVDFIQSADNGAMMNTKKRTCGEGGLIGRHDNVDYEELDERDIHGREKHGPLLLTTALFEYTRLNGGLPANIDEREEPEMVRALAEYAAMTERNDAEGGEHRQQIGNLDIIFNFFLHCRAAGIINNVATVPAIMKRLNLTLHSIGLKIQGRVKTN